jgi:hypothetical protein
MAPHARRATIISVANDIACEIISVANDQFPGAAGELRRALTCCNGYSNSCSKKGLPGGDGYPP